MQLVIVESPAKAKTIEKYLGKDFKVLASYGHVRDLPPKDGSVRPDEDFAMDSELYRDKQKRFKEISDAAKGADRLVLATDPDREGEAISWHVRELLAKRKTLPAKVDRVTFNAITKQAVTDAMKAPRELEEVGEGHAAIGSARRMNVQLPSRHVGVNGVELLCKVAIALAIALSVSHVAQTCSRAWASEA